MSQTTFSAKMTPLADQDLWSWWLAEVAGEGGARVGTGLLLITVIICRGGVARGDLELKEKAMACFIVQKKLNLLYFRLRSFISAMIILAGIQTGT